MHWDRRSIFDELSTKQTADDLYSAVAVIAQQLGFPYCCYGMRLPIPISNRPVHIFNNYPEGWIRHYLDRSYMKHDPVVLLGAQKSAPLVWSRETFSQASDLWRDAQDWGLRNGISQSVWTPPGVFGVLSLARPEDPLSAVEILQLSEPLMWLANVVHGLIVRFYPLPARIETPCELTPRELEVLSWTGEGKTAYEIGKILNISARTVNFHVCNVLTKLCVSNKVQAAVKAVALGLI